MEEDEERARRVNPMPLMGKRRGSPPAGGGGGILSMIGLRMLRRRPGWCGRRLRCSWRSATPTGAILPRGDPGPGLEPRLRRRLRRRSRLHLLRAAPHPPPPLDLRLRPPVPPPRFVRLPRVPPPLLPPPRAPPGLLHQFLSIPKRLESMNTMLSFLWWVFGFYWSVVGGQALLQDAPRLYWLTVVFLAFDVFFAICCIALACVIGIALCCCLPCIIAILYAITGQEGASDADISVLPRFRYRQINQEESFDIESQQAVALTATERDHGGSLDELALPPADSECCICLTQYEDGAELHSLPCNHHFHSQCIVKWLRINPTCPLCKYNIIKAHEQV